MPLVANEQKITMNTNEKEAKYLPANRTAMERKIICLLKRRRLSNLMVARKITTDKKAVSMSSKLKAL